jgi:hypothetical protein
LIRSKPLNSIAIKFKSLTVALTGLVLVAPFYSLAGTVATPPPTRSLAATTIVRSAQNESLDFTLVNKTGYTIKALYIGKSGTGDWVKEDEVLKGKSFNAGTELPIKFHPKESAEKWDVMVTWADGSGNVEWLNLKLTEITKLTLVYDKEKDKTSAIID